MKYFYIDGTEVMVGDIVKTGMGINRGIIVELFVPNSEDAKAYSSPNGGVLIDTEWPEGKHGWLVISDISNEEDIVLISRKTDMDEKC